MDYSPTPTNTNASDNDVTNHSGVEVANSNMEMGNDNDVTNNSGVEVVYNSRKRSFPNIWNICPTIRWPIRLLNIIYIKYSKNII